MGRPLGKGSGKKNIPLRIAAVLYCLTVISAYFATGLLARYSTSNQSGGYARAAKFSIVGNGEFYQTVQADVAPGDEKTVLLSVENNSEVAVEYTVEAANNTKNLPLIIRLKKADSTELTEGDTFTEQKLPEHHTDKYTLYITWETGKTDPKVMGMVDYITVTVTASQID